MTKPPFESVVVAALLDQQPNGETPFLAHCLEHPECFDDQRHRKVVAEIKTLAAANLPVTAERIAAGVTFEGAITFVSNCLSTCCLPLEAAEQEAKIVWEDFRRREAKRILSEANADLDSQPEQAEKILECVGTDLARLNAGASLDGLPAIVDASKFLSEPLPLPPELLQGVVYQGSKLAIGGGSKTFKTWNLLALAVATATGKPWLGIPTAKGKVLFCNFEISRAQWQRRLNAVAKAMTVQLKSGDISLWNLRGFASDYKTIIPKILARAKAEGYALIILDPIYKLYGDADENSAGDIAKLLNTIEQLSTETRATVAYANHFAKGDASQKATADRISGSGVFARDPDALIIFTAHETPDSFTVETVLRDFPPVPPFVVTWQFPVMARNDDLDPARLKQNGGRPTKHRPDDLLALLPPGGLTNAEWLATADENGITRSTYYELRKALQKSEKVADSTTAGKWLPVTPKPKP